MKVSKVSGAPGASRKLSRRFWTTTAVGPALKNTSGSWSTSCPSAEVWETANERGGPTRRALGRALNHQKESVYLPDRGAGQDRAGQPRRDGSDPRRHHFHRLTPTTSAATTGAAQARARRRRSASRDAWAA